MSKKKAIKNVKDTRVKNNVACDAAAAMPGLGGGVNPFNLNGLDGIFGNFGRRNDSLSSAGTAFINLRGYLISNMRELLSQLYVEIGLIQTIIDVPVDDALRGGIEIKSKQLSEEELEELTNAIDRDEDLSVVAQGAKWMRLFGGGALIIMTDEDPETPFDIRFMEEGEYLEFRAVDTGELTWDKAANYNADDRTEYYYLYGVKIHHSRVLKMKGMRAPAHMMRSLQGWGLSVVEALIRSLNQYFKATDLMYEVLDEFKVDVYKIKNLVNTLLSPSGENTVKKRVALANYQKNYQNAVVMDSEDDWDHKQLSFSGLAESMEGIRVQVASDMRMPMLKLFGVPASGLNASDEPSLEVYNSMVESQIRSKIKGTILKVCQIKCQQLFGMVPDDLSLTFKPLRVLSAVDEENVKTQKFNRALQAMQAQGITFEEFRDAVNREELLGITLATDLPHVGFVQPLQSGSDETSEDEDEADKEKDKKPKGESTTETERALNELYRGS